MKFLNSEGVEKLCEKIGNLLAGKLNSIQGLENAGKVQIVNDNGVVQPGNLSGNFPEDVIADSSTLNPISVRELSQSVSRFNSKIGEQETQISENKEETDEFVQTVEDEFQETNGKLGDLSELTTETKTDIVSAINESVDAILEAKADIDQLDNRITENTQKINEYKSAADTLAEEVETVKDGAEELQNQISANQNDIQTNSQAIENLDKMKAGTLIDEEVGNPLTGIVTDKTIQNPAVYLKELGETTQETSLGDNLFNINGKITIDGTIYYGSYVNIPSGTKLYIRREGGVSLAIQGLDSSGSIVNVVSSSYVTESKVIITTNTDLTALLITSSSRDSFVYRNGKLMVSKTDFTNWEEYVGGEPSPNIEYPKTVVPLQGYDVFDGDTYSRSDEFNPEDSLQFYAVKIEDNDGHMKWIGTKNKIPALYDGDTIDFISGTVKWKNEKIDCLAGTKEWSSDGDGYVYTTIEELPELDPDRKIYSNVSIPESIYIEGNEVRIQTSKSADMWNSADVYFIVPLSEEIEEVTDIVGLFPADYNSMKLTGTGVLNLKYAVDLKTFIVKTIQNILG